MRRSSALLLPWVALGALGSAQACAADAPVATSAPAFDAALARSVGADDRGMRGYVFVLLKSGPVRIPEGAERERMFEGHFANMERLAAAGKLVLAGPFDGVDGWRGMFVFASEDVEEVRKLVANDPVIQKGEMVAEYHQYYGSAALMLVNELHGKIERR